MNGEQMCAYILSIAKKYPDAFAEGFTDLKPLEIWNASPTGELWHVFQLYDKAYSLDHPELERVIDDEFNIRWVKRV